MNGAIAWVSGASSGIGQALVRHAPEGVERLIGVSRRPPEGAEHLAADLATEAGWDALAASFEAELTGGSWRLAFFFHCAATLSPMGFVGEVPADAYRREILLNAASPLVLGDAFLRAVRLGATPGVVVQISSGAARSVYLGWSGYGPSKAAVDHWVRHVGAEQDAREGLGRAIAVAPGVVATAMQEAIRATDAADFPQVERFHALHDEGALRSPDDVAPALWRLAMDGGVANGSVLDLRELP
jgi:NAD(P)-dependent dehydrogenase (short-subunit alcohol dehydrogenase family)